MQGGYVSRRVRCQTPLRENAGASSFRREEQACGQTVFLCATARCHPAALRLSPGDRRRPEILGRAQRAVARPGGEGLRGARGRPPRGVRRFRRQHSGRQLRRRQRDAVGPRHVRPAGRCRGRGATGARRSEVPPARRKAEGRFRHRPHEAPRQGQGQRVAAHQEARRVRRRRAGTWRRWPTACSPAAPRKRSRATCRRARRNARRRARPIASGPPVRRPNARGAARRQPDGVRQARARQEETQVRPGEPQGRATRGNAGVHRADEGDDRGARAARRRLALRGEVGWRARRGLRGQRRGPPAGAQRPALRTAVSRTGRDAAPHRRIAGRARWRDRRARCQGRLAVPPHTAAHRQHRPEHHRSPGALHAGDLLRLRPALPGRLRPAQRRSG